MKKNIILSFFLAIVATVSMYAQNEDKNRIGLYIAGGLTTSWFVGNERLTLPFSPTLPLPDSVDDFVPGAYYRGQFPGIGVRGIWIFDQEKKFRANFGFDYHFYTSRDRELSGSLTIFKSNTHYIPAFTGGFQYAFINLPIAQAKVYGGIDFRGTFVVSNTYEERQEYVNNGALNKTFTRSKDGTFRFGGGGHLGVEGEIEDPVYVNLSVGWSAMNILGRDDERGELLTPYPDKIYENKETRVYNIFANIFVQYRL